jgi:SAM-dependent methyltransferase
MSFTRSPEPPLQIENIQDFYTEILEYYDELFPLKEEVVQLFSQLLAEQQESSTLKTVPLCRFLNIGCATGTLENRLSGFAMDITGIDKNPRMIETANRRMKRKSSTLRFFEMSALEMGRFLKQGSFHIISCIDNTLPYISDEILLRKFFHDTCGLLSPGGKFVIQNINFDGIKTTNPTRLPDLGSVRVTLQRSFLPAENGLVLLDAALELGNGRKISLQKTTTLLPATRAKMESYAKEAGFAGSEAYSDFALSPWNEESPYIVQVFTK